MGLFEVDNRFRSSQHGSSPSTSTINEATKLTPLVLAGSIAVLAFSALLVLFLTTGHLNDALTATAHHPVPALGLALFALAIVRLIGLKTLRYRNSQPKCPTNVDRSFSCAVLESLREGILAADSHGKLTLVNTALRNLYGTDAKPIALEKWHDQFPVYMCDGSRLFTKAEHPLTRALNGESFEDLEVLILNGHGEARYCLISGRPIRDAIGGVLGALIVLHDISESRRAEHLLSNVPTMPS
jgi:PAS domain S-box-containing protein